MRGGEDSLFCPRVAVRLFRVGFGRSECMFDPKNMGQGAEDATEPELVRSFGLIISN